MLYTETLVFIVSHMDHNKSTICAKCRDLVLNLAVHTTGLQRTIEMPFTVSQQRISKEKWYIFFDTCSNFIVFFHYETQDDNLLLALCGLTSSYRPVWKTLGFSILHFICVSRMYKHVRMNAISLLLSTKLFTVYHRILQYCCIFYLLHEIMPVMKSHCQF
jgi:hypothetical protein